MTKQPSDDAGSSTALVPVMKTTEQNRSVRGGLTIGDLLHGARKRAGFSSAAVCRALFLSDTELADYESGIREPSHSLIERMADLYGVDPDRLRSDSRADRGVNEAKHDTLWLGWAPVDLDEYASTDDRLRTISHTIRSMRKISETTPITIRDEELEVIVGVLDLDDGDLPALLMRWFSLSAQQSGELLARLHHAAATVKALPAAGDGSATAPSAD